MNLILLLKFLLSLTLISLLHYAHNAMNYFLDLQGKIKNAPKLSTHFIEIFKQWTQCVTRILFLWDFTREQGVTCRLVWSFA